MKMSKRAFSKPDTKAYRVANNNCVLNRIWNAHYALRFDGTSN